MVGELKINLANVISMYAFTSLINGWDGKFFLATVLAGYFKSLCEKLPVGSFFLKTIKRLARC